MQFEQRETTKIWECWSNPFGEDTIANHFDQNISLDVEFYKKKDSYMTETFNSKRETDCTKELFKCNDCGKLCKNQNNYITTPSN